jgi:hypothetical protein
MPASAFALVHELRQGLKALKAQELDAYFYTSDAMVAGQASFIIDTTKGEEVTDDVRRSQSRCAGSPR